MKGTNNHTGLWTPDILNSIYTGATSAVGAIHIAGKVVPTVSTTQSLSRPCVELGVEFTLTNGQVKQHGSEITGS